MKTLKSIQKNQEQLNSLLMEKWGYKNTLTEEKFEPGEQDEKYKKKPDADDKEETPPKKEKGKLKRSTDYDKTPPKPPKKEKGKYVPSLPTPTTDYAKTPPKPPKKEKGNVAADQIKEEMDFDDEFEPADALAAPDVNSSAMATTLSTADAPPMMEKEGEDLTGDGKINSDDYLAAKDKAIKANLEEQHNCKSAHPGMNHDQWSNKYR